MTNELNRSDQVAVDSTPLRSRPAQLAAIDPQLRLFVAGLEQSRARFPAASELSIDEMRRVAEEVRQPWRSGGPAMAATEELQVPTVHGSVRVRLYRPAMRSGPQPALVYLHGGGWAMFSIDTHDRLMRELAARAGVVVLGVDYALSPEAKFPFALQQIESVVRWLYVNGAELGIDAGRMAIGGDSAGANLSVGTCLRLRDAGAAQLLKGMLLFYGCYTSELSEWSANGYGAEGNLLSASEMSWFWQNYLAEPADALDPLASPLRARLEGLPPVFQATAQCDVLAEQGTAFAARLREAGVAAVEHEYAGAIHSFLEAVSIAPIAGRALDDSAAWLRECLQTSAGEGGQ